MQLNNIKYLINYKNNNLFNIIINYKLRKLIEFFIYYFHTP